MINPHGDRLLPTTGRHGADIARQRLDALDAAALGEVIARVAAPGAVGRPGAAAIDLGCGYGLQGLRFAALGQRTLLIDQLPREASVLGLPGLDALLPLDHLCADARALTAESLPEVALLYSQRFLHYLRHDEAVTLLRHLRARMQPGTRGYLSVSGLDSELGDGYAARGQRLADRYAVLAAPVAERHGIHAPVCLYTEADLMALCAAASLRCERVERSTFGNVKTVCIAV